MDIIHLLPDSVANQIAAGEVIQRPASCLKELVENSLDAGATYIQIILRDAGSTLLQVIDNGKGMSETDARMAFERHATSKIQSATDLYALHTMGFRGEALASIAAVAKVELLTRRPEDQIGTYLEIAGSRVMAQEPAQAPVGTSIKVKDLFFNLPARRRFLKKEDTEKRNLLRDFYRIALVYPQVQFLLVNNDEVLVDLPKQTVKERIESIFGSAQKKTFSSQLVELQANTPLVNITGFVGKPESASKKPQQFFFVNGRYMHHPYFHKAVLSAYSGMLGQEQNPSYFIYFEIAPDEIDVNIHPTKTEIKFTNEQYIWQILSATVRESLGKFHVAPSLDFDKEEPFEIPAATRTNTHFDAPHVQVNTAYNPFKSQSTYQPQKVETKGWENLFPVPEQRPVSSVEASSEKRITIDEVQAQTAIALPPKHILLPMPEGLMVIDQHRAHLAVQYAHFCEQIAEQQGIMQQVLFPEVVDLSVDEIELLLSIQDDLRFAGFDITQISKQTFSIDAVPAELSGQNAETILRVLLQDLTTNLQEARVPKIALTLAKATAIPAGKVLSKEEITDLLTRLFALSDYVFTPEGKRIVSLISTEEIENKFK